MSILRRLLFISALTLVVVVGVLILGVGVIEGQRRVQASVEESRGTANIIVAALVTGSLDEDPALASAFLRDVAERMGGAGATGAAVPREIVVMHSSGTVIAGTADHKRGSVFAGAGGPIADAVRTQEPVMFRVVGDDATQTYCAVPTEMDGVPVVVAVEHMSGADPAPFWRLLGGFGVLALATGAVLLALQAGLVGRWVIEPLNKLRVAMDSLGWGEFSTRLPESSVPELGAVIESFNSMSTRLDDMTDRRRELEIAADSLPSGLVLTDEKGVIRWSSKRASELLRVPARELKGSSWTTVVSDAEILKHASGSDADRPRGWTDERVLDVAGQEKAWLALEGFPVVRDDGRLLANAVVVTDVTAARTWRSEQRRLMGALSEANRLRGGLFRLLRGDLGARLALLADRDWEAREMIALLGELGGVESEYLRAVVDECPMDEVIEAAIESRAVLAASRGINVQVRSRDLEVLADREGLVRCLGHALSAAFYAAQGSVRVVVGVELNQGTGRRARVDLEVLAPELGDLDVEDLMGGRFDAAMMGAGPGMFGLALYLAARYAVVMRLEFELRRGDEGALVIGLGIPLSPLAAEVRRGPADAAVPLEGATVDALTGLLSRSVFERTLSELVFRATRLDRGLAVLALDIDGLGLLNRRYGAGTGDRLLREVSDTIRNALRKDDVVGRVRGAVIMIALPDTDRKVALVVAEKIGWSISRHIAATPDNQPAGRLTASIGLAGYPHNGTAARELMREAESAMRAAKAEGGNQVKEAEIRVS